MIAKREVDGLGFVALPHRARHQRDEVSTAGFAIGVLPLRGGRKVPYPFAPKPEYDAVDAPRRPTERCKPTLDDCLRYNVAHFGDRIAATIDGDALTYAAARAHGRRGAPAASARRIAPGDRVALWLPQLVRLDRSFLAVTALGARARCRSTPA